MSVGFANAKVLIVAPTDSTTIKAITKAIRGFIGFPHRVEQMRLSPDLPLIAPIRDSKEGLKEKSVTAITLWSNRKKL